LRPDDAPALRTLEQECAAADGNPNPLDEAAILRVLDAAGTDANTLCAASADGSLVAWASVAFDTSFAHERRAYLTGGVHPAFRHQGLGSQLLAWMGARASQLYTSIHDNRPLVMRIDVYHQNPEAFAFYERRGFGFALSEEELLRNLGQPIPGNPVPEGMMFAVWTEEDAHLFFLAYDDAFRDRPGFPGWTEEVWRKAFTGHDSFRSDLSLLLLDGEEPAGYAVCAVEEGEGWIAQIGVRPAWRRRGLAGALLSEVMRRFRAKGFSEAVLGVNVNNPRALSVYLRLGFVRAKRYTSYRKTVGRRERPGG
jgi:mycothiol synthase